MRAYGNDIAHVGFARWHFRIGFFNRVALIVGRGSGYLVFGFMYDPDEDAMLIGVPGLVIGINL